MPLKLDKIAFDPAADSAEMVLTGSASELEKAKTCLEQRGEFSPVMYKGFSSQDLTVKIPAVSRRFKEAGIGATPFQQCLDSVLTHLEEVKPGYDNWLKISSEIKLGGDGGLVPVVKVHAKSSSASPEIIQVLTEHTRLGLVEKLESDSGRLVNVDWGYLERGRPSRPLALDELYNEYGPLEPFPASDKHAAQAFLGKMQDTTCRAMGLSNPLSRNP